MSFSSNNISIKINGSEQQKTVCPNCKKLGKIHLKDTSLSVNLKTGAFHCHKCSWHGCAFIGEKMDTREYLKPEKKNFTNLSDENLQYCSKRGITQEVVKRNKLINSQKGWLCFPYFYDDEFVNFKMRDIENKNFRQQTDGRQIIYKYNDVKNSKEIIICEGEFDCLAYEVAGFINTTSVSQGAPNENDQNVDKKLECITNCFHVFENSELIYLAVDNDANGNRLKNELIKRFGFEKCKTVDFKDCKDANEYLLKYGSDELRLTIENAKEIKMFGIFRVEDVYENMIYTFRNGKERGTSTYIKSLDQHWTWKKKEVNIWSGYNNDGKSSFFAQLAILKAKNEDWKFAIVTPENLPIEDYFDDLVHCYMGKSTDKVFENVMSENEYSESCKFINDHFFLVSPSEEEGMKIDIIFEKFRYLIQKNGIDVCLLDPYNQIEHLMDKGEREDLYISRFMSKLKRFAVTNDISMNLIAHQKTPVMKKDSLDYPRPDMYNVKGGGTFSDKADSVILVWRKFRKSKWESKVVAICVEKIRKQRLIGIPGDIELYYSRQKNQYSESENFIPENTLHKEYHEEKFKIEESEEFVPIEPELNSPF